MLKSVKFLQTSVTRFAFCFLLLLLFSSFNTPLPRHWYGTLTIKPMTFHLYIRYEGDSSRLYILSPKANEINLNKFSFGNDSLYFSRSDFYTEYHGRYRAASNTIDGIWTGEDQKRYPIIFRPVNPDTLVGLKPKVNPTFEWQDPDVMDDGLKTCAASQANIDIALLDSLTVSIMNERYPNIQSLIIAKDDCLIYEDYFYGWKPDDLWLIQSVTKSFRQCTYRDCPCQR